MGTCPVCNNVVAEGAASCPACGFHFNEGTQAFKAVSIDSVTDISKGAPTAAPTLTVRYASGRQEGLVYTLEKDEMTVGRSPKCDIFLNDMTVSRSHAVLQRVGSDWSIMDTQSFNGLWVNHQPAEHAMLKDGDVIQIGCFVLKYEK